MGANQSKIDYASSLKSTPVPNTNSRRNSTSTTTTTRRSVVSLSAAAAAVLPQPSSTGRQRAVASTGVEEDPLEGSLSRCTTRSQHHARYNSISNCTTASNTMAVTDSGYIGSGLMFPLTSTITDLGGRASLSDDATTAQTNSPTSVIALASQWLTNTTIQHCHLSPPPSYHRRPPLTTHAISTDTVLRDLRRAPHKTHAILNRVFETAWHLQDPRDHAAAYQTALTWAQETTAADNDADDSTNNASQVAAVWVARCMLDGWGVHGQVRAGFEMLRDLADHGVWQAFLPLATCYFEGVTTHDGQTVQPVDHALALSWFSTAAQLDPAKLCINGENNAKQVVAIAQMLVGDMTLKEQGEPHLAFSWFLKSANNDNPYAQFMVAVYYAIGNIVDRDLDKTKEYLRKSAEQDYGLAQTDLGILLFEEKKYKEAMQWLERAEQSNDSRALCYLGYVYESGEGVPAAVNPAISNNERAIYYFKAAAERNNVLAQYHLGLHYFDGTLGLQRDLAKAMHFLKQAADAGHPPAQRRLGLMYLEGLNTPSHTHHARIQQQKDDGLARAWFEKAAFEGRDGQAYVLLGECYEKGRGVKEANVEQALAYYRQGAEIKGPHQVNGFYAHASLLFSLGRHNEAYLSYVRASEQVVQHRQQQSMMMPYDLDVDLNHHKQLVRLAQMMVARFSIHGWADMPVDLPRAFKILQQLANHDKDVGDEVDYWFATCYLEGMKDVCQVDPTMAFTYYTKAAKGGDKDAQFEVGHMLQHGIGTPLSLDEATVWYKKAAKKGHPTAMYRLALYNLVHLRNWNNAIKYFERAIDLGHMPSTEHLVKLYKVLRARPVDTATGFADSVPDNGSSSSSSSASARKRHVDRINTVLGIIIQAAEKGNNRVAQRELGKLHDRALGVPMDHKKAFDLFSKAARQNDGIATLMLGSYYEHGKTVHQDERHALALYQRAAALGTEEGLFAAAELLHKFEQFDEAYKYYTMAAKHEKLGKAQTGKRARLMVARYILYDYITATTTTTTDTKDEAFGELCALAAEEHFSPAYFWIGDCYHHGRGTTVDLSLALRWYTDAAKEARNADAMIRLAKVFDNGMEGLVTPDDDMAFQYYRRAAELGDPEGQYNVGKAYWRGLYDLPIDEVKASQYFTESASKGYGPSHWALGQMSHENGSDDLALESWDRGAKLGDLGSMREQGHLLLAMLPKIFDDQDRQKQYVRAVTLLTDAANQGDAESDLYLGRIFLGEAKAHQLTMMHMMDKDNDHDNSEADLQAMHYNLQKDKEEDAKHHLERAAAAGLVEAMYHAGEIWYEQGDFEAAYPFYEKAADRGFAPARVMRARYKLSIQLPGIETDPEAGFKELLECAENDRCTLAYYTLGQCYERGLGTQSDDDQALEWYYRSFEASRDAEAVFRIGSIQANLGRHDDAAKWYQLACRHGDHTRAHYELGRYYLHNAVSPRLEDAVQHLEHAALQNDVDAMYELGSLLLLSNNGTFGVEQQQNGLLWLERAATRFDHLSSLVLLGEMYRTGKDYCPMTADARDLDTDHMVTVVPVQLDRAFDLFCQAAELGDMTAMLYVGRFYEHGFHVSVNIAKAKAWYELALDAPGSGWAAQVSLARLLHHHYEDERPRAYHLFESALASAKTDEERFEPEVYLSRYHLFGYHGETVPQQQMTAMDTLLRYARSGETIVYYDVARAYEQGLGVPRPDINGALVWYSKLEELATTLDPNQESLLDRDLRQNITDALSRLAAIYGLGLAGTPTDRARADALEEQAAQRGAES